MNIADKISVATGNIPKVYRTGRVSVINPNSNWINWAEWATKAQTTTLYDSLQYDDTKDVENFNQMFVSYNGTVAKEIDTRNGKNFYQMFALSNIVQPPVLNLSQGENFESMFFGCPNLERVPVLNTIKGKRFNSMFSCRNICSSKLKTIESICVDNAESLTNMLGGCYSLVEIRFEGVIPTDIDFSDCNKISNESLLDAISRLKFYGSSTLYPEHHKKHTITFPTGRWNELALMLMPEIKDPDAVGINVGLVGEWFELNGWLVA